ncbi:MAG: ATP-dependent DNA helicase RecG [Clostridium sp. 28_12]|nr:MAG: ATP-dependent DNA helicase RecG [Clostridium sp. 28_12]
MVDLDKDVKYVKTVGPNRVQLLNKLNIYTLKDLIEYYPRDYEDRSKPKNLYECTDGEEVLIEAMAAGRITEMHKGRMTISRLIVKDQTGTCYITWFNQGYLRDKFQPGRMYRFFGKISNKNGRLEMNSPVYDEIDQSKNTGKIIPIYPLTYELKQNTLRKIIENGLAEVKGKLTETLPEYILKENNLWDINNTIERIHFPIEFSDFNKARERLVFEELLTTQLALLKLKNNYEHETDGIQFSKDVYMSDVINILPFKLTKAQLRVLEEIDRDMESNKPMNRLLQGDVGSGKTVVAMIAAYKAVKSGYQATIMAPTAILASQHLESFQGILEELGIKTELLISSVTKKKKSEILEKLQSGEIDILIGTHAILEENVVFKNLGLVVTDEQHRFGVKQRGTIASKGQNPDVIAMSATPIPRTLALILYGDLDISIIDELPPNRKKIETYAVRKNMEERVNNFIRKQITEGRQAYIVCPLVEENEDMEGLQSVIELAEKYQKETFSEYKVAYLHGKMKPKEKDEIMERFKNGEIQILIATTVIEVGVNVPNSSIMVVENAERFGLAQLHQLRGRVGRGEYQSYCILKYEGNSETIKQRMKVMCDTNDGFIISEKDLELRGSGDFFGTEQHGLPEFKIANLFEDIAVLKKVQRLALKIMEDDPLLEKEKNAKLNNLVKEKFSSRIEI